VVKRFVTKRVEIEAMRWTGDNYTAMFNWTEGHFQKARDDRHLDSDITAEVWDFLHSTWIGVKTGQWIVKGAKGEFYPCDDETFHWKYEEVITENQYANGHTYDRT
jgi:hypothetical protein